MYDISKIYRKFSTIITKFLYLKVVSLKKTTFLILVSLSVMFFDAMSIISIMPLIDFIRLGQDIEIYTAETKYAEQLIEVYLFLNVPFNLLTLSSVILFLVIFRQLLNLIEIIQLEKTRLIMSRDLSFKCFNSILSANANYIRNFKTGQFTVLCERESNEVSLLYRNFLNFFSASAQITAYFLIIAYVSLYSTLAASLIIILLLYSMAIFVKKANVAAIGTVDYRKSFYSSLTENFNLWRLLKFQANFDRENKHILHLANQYANYQLKIVKFNAQSRLLIAILAMFSCIIILNIVVKFENLELASIAFFALILVRLIPLGQKLNLLMSGFAKLEPSLSVVCSTLENANSNLENLKVGSKFDKNFSTIKFKDVSFKYGDSNHSALDKVNLTIPSKKITAVIGKSGAGKSTLIDLIPRIISPSEGNIFFDNKNVKDFSLSSLRKNISFIYQDSVLYDASIEDNIKYFNIAASDKEFEEVCSLSGIADFINIFPGKYKYNVAESGQKLSGGQKQRVILARAFMSKAQILIMDEATSALDNESENNIRQSIKNLVRVKEKTVIVIAHRKNTIKDADLVIYIKNGTVLDSGKPEKIFKEYPNL